MTGSHHLKWLSDSTKAVIRALNLHSESCKVMVGYEVAITFFLAVCILSFLLHDFALAVLALLSNGPVASHSPQIFIVSATVVVVSLCALLVRESLEKRALLAQARPTEAEPRTTVVAINPEPRHQRRRTAKKL